MTMFKGLDAKLEKENDTLDKIVSLCTYFPGLLSTQDPDLKSWGTKQWSMVMHVTHSPPLILMFLRLPLILSFYSHKNNMLATCWKAEHSPSTLKYAFPFYFTFFQGHRSAIPRISFTYSSYSGINWSFFSYHGYPFIS